MTHVASAELAAAVLDDGRELTVRLAGADDAAGILDLVHAGFSARPVVGARPEALGDDLASVSARLERGVAYLGEVDGAAVGVVMVAPHDGSQRLGRVCVLPEHRSLGVASFLVGVALEDLATRGESHVHLLARREYPGLIRWWQRHGFAIVGDEGDCHVMERELPVAVRVPDADAMRALGARLASVLRAGDLVLASGDLGAGKTTLAQGLGAGLGVLGPVISPTFVLARVHPAAGEGPALVHVDAYRLGGFAELEDLDLEASLDEAVTLVEWGTGVAEGLADDRLEIAIRRGLDAADDTRWVFLTGVGGRWARSDVDAAATREDA